jgi:hypothetical protein
LIKDRWIQPNSMRDHGLLVVSADLGKCAANLRKEMPADLPIKGKKNVSALIASLIAENLMFEINSLLLLANVLYPGALTTAKGFAFVDDSYVAETPAFYAEGWFRAVDAAQRYGWPTLQKLGVSQAWSWLAATGCVDGGTAKQPIGRALAALSYVAPQRADSESGLNLVWVLLGLEALYCTSNIGLREQLVSKTELVLGLRTENKKAFGNMYDFRSRLLHGDMDLPLRYSPFNAEADYQRHQSNLSDHEGLGLAALICTIQVMIRNGWRGLEFQYRHDGIPLPPITQP